MSNLCLCVQLVLMCSSGPSTKSLLTLLVQCWVKPWQSSRKRSGRLRELSPRESDSGLGRARATGPGSSWLLLCPTSVCQGCIKFHMRGRVLAWESPPTAGKWTVRKWAIIKNSPNKRRPSNVLTSNCIIYPYIHRLPVENISQHIQYTVYLLRRHTV